MFSFYQRNCHVFIFFFSVCYVLHSWSWLLFYLVAPKGAVCFFVCLVYPPSPSVHSGKSRLSATAWLTVRWPRIRPTSWTVWSGGRGTCMEGSNFCMERSNSCMERSNSCMERSDFDYGAKWLLVGAKWPWGEMTMGRNDHGAKWPDTDEKTSFLKSDTQTNWDFETYP